MGYKYAYQGEAKNTARAVVTDVPVSTKSAIMVADFVRGKTVSRAQRDLGLVREKRMAVPFTRFTEGAGHKPGSVGPGKYPNKASEHFLKAINSAEANARDIGLGDDLVIKSVTAHQAARPMRYGRIRGRQRKGTHIEIVVGEADAKKATKSPSKSSKTAPKKSSQKKSASSTKSDSSKKTEKSQKNTQKASPKPATTKEKAETKEKKE